MTLNQPFTITSSRREHTQKCAASQTSSTDIFPNLVIRPSSPSQPDSCQSARRIAVRRAFDIPGVGGASSSRSLAWLPLSITSGFPSHLASLRLRLNRLFPVFFFFFFFVFFFSRSENLLNCDSRGAASHDRRAYRCRRHIYNTKRTAYRTAAY
ncbi:uncharacterized protein F4817DRAFT_279292 [Daldinia loculata]|uniref:uncharacterized protein n=1 Tax=Daldinia loculata TaxID=103429 RepID=UPI0020C3E843|nr:uncharacterized protein F4817DRAFT_279292 [Daldinia loculata]KAI1650112.1 hypothetical protein F4817DRAFT_279292 [Daldinia loculata]